MCSLMSIFFGCRASKSAEGQALLETSGGLEVQVIQKLASGGLSLPQLRQIKADTRMSFGERGIG